MKKGRAFRVAIALAIVAVVGAILLARSYWLSIGESRAVAELLATGALVSFDSDLDAEAATGWVLWHEADVRAPSAAFAKLASAGALTTGAYGDLRWVWLRKGEAAEVLLRHAEKLPSIDTLRLSGSLGGPYSAKTLAALSSIKQLEWLTLVGLSIDDVMAKALTGATQLERLNLDNCEISDLDAATIRNALSQTRVEIRNSADADAAVD